MHFGMQFQASKAKSTEKPPFIHVVILDESFGTSLFEFFPQALNLLSVSP